MQYPIHPETVTCKTLMARHAWIQFPQERNRWHLEEVWSKLTLIDLIQEPAEFQVHKTTDSPLTIEILRLTDGGLISYRKGELTLHTLNTLTMFKQKVWDLGLWTPGEQ